VKEASAFTRLFQNNRKEIEEKIVVRENRKKKETDIVNR
jgi:hypothetical protein